MGDVHYEVVSKTTGLLVKLDNYALGGFRYIVSVVDSQGRDKVKGRFDYLRDAYVYFNLCAR